MLDDLDLLVCGAGPVGCVVAERAARIGWRVLVIDQRTTIGGNCHDSAHESGVLVHRYGPHYFRTRDERLVRYLSRFTDWIPANYEVRSLAKGRLHPFPINLTTLEMVTGKAMDERSAAAHLDAASMPVPTPRDSEQFVVSRVGRELYETFYRGYTRKQWGRDASELGPEVCGRIPVRLDRSTSYVDHPFQMMPAQGFTALFKRMLRHRSIRLMLGCSFDAIRHHAKPRFGTVYTGPVDAYFGHRFGRLPYRSLQFDLVHVERERVQPCVQVNYPGEDVPFTRSVEIKHVTGQAHPHTVISFETPRAAGQPYYPVPSGEGKRLHQRYERLAEEETRTRNVHFCGRLAQYRYFDTDEAILEAMSCFKRIKRRAWATA
ncbi:MAG: FAD-dependent oxidoreductase [Gemmataceae bacterium]|nr:FAD-dependent oxidoreductase [Gemmataceae bacterium]